MYLYTAWTTTPGQRFGNNLFLHWLHNYLLAICGPFHLAPVILLVWIIGSVQGFRRGHPAWTELLGRAPGGIWVVYWIMLLILGPIFR